MENKERPLMRLFKLFPGKPRLFLGIMVTILSSTLMVAFSYLMMLTVDAALEGERDFFFRVLMAAGVFVVITLVMTYGRTKLIGSYTERGMAVLRERFGAKIAEMSFDVMQKTHSGELLSRGTNDMQRIRNFTFTSLPRLIQIPLTAMLALVLLFIFNWQLTLIALAMAPILIIGSSFLARPIAKASKRVQEKLGRVNSVLTDFIKGAEVVKAYNLEETLGEKNRLYVDESVESGRHLAKRHAVLDAFGRAFGLVPFIATFLFGGYFVIQGTMTVGMLLAFINLLNYLTFPLSTFATLLGETKRDLVSASRVFDILDAEEERKDGKAHPFEMKDPLIAFENVSFNYKGDDKLVIRNLDFQVRPGETVAIAGPSGGGKSTITRLLLGYFDHYEGNIFLGGHEVRDWNLASLRQNIAIVSQETFLFPESIKENLAHGKPRATDEEIVTAAKQANAHDFIAASPAGYDSELGELGNTLSGGQKQRLSIARAILKDAPVLLLDEATSALDLESEALIQEALAEITADKTTVIIAHRLSTIKDADRILVVDEGTIKEEGDHESLLARKGLYARLYERQQDIEEGGVDDESEEERLATATANV